MSQLPPQNLPRVRSQQEGRLRDDYEDRVDASLTDLTVEESAALAELMTSEPKVNEKSLAAMQSHKEILDR